MWTPWDNAAVARLATPLLKVAGKPSIPPSALNCTDPPGNPLPGATAATLALKVRFDPGGQGLAEEIRAIWDEAGVIVSQPLLNVKL